MNIIATFATRFFLTPLAALWRWLSADPVRLAFTLLLGLCAFLGWRLSSVDGDRDDWREKAKAYELASQIIEDADAIADAEALDVAGDMKGTIDAVTEQARDDARDSGDPLDAIARRLREEGDRGSR